MKTERKPSRANVNFLFNKMFQQINPAWPETVQAAIKAFDEAMLENPRYIAERRENGDTLIIAAIARNAVDVVHHILAAGGDPNLTSSQGVSPLQSASQGGSVEMVRALLERGAKTAHRDFTGATALHYALLRDKSRFGRQNMMPILTALLEAGADPMVCNRHGLRPFHLAAENGYVEAFHALMPSHAQRKALFNQTVMEDGVNLFHFLGGAPETARQIMRAALEAGGDPFQTSWIGQTAVHSQARWHNAPLIPDLVALGIDVNAQDAAGRTALHVACDAKSLGSATVLLHAGADPEIVDVTGASAMDAIAKLANGTPDAPAWQRVHDLARSSLALNVIEEVGASPLSDIKPL